ncbi:hypothetical protein LZ30DRAFT_54458 [Colletotrichum cereale]|nr:hypothetical protein LZ30DRAFT_54458 [Colletotrichum cereale]
MMERMNRGQMRVCSRWSQKGPGLLGNGVVTDEGVRQSVCLAGRSSQTTEPFLCLRMEFLSPLTKEMRSGGARPPPRTDEGRQGWPPEDFWGWGCLKLDWSGSRWPRRKIPWAAEGGLEARDVATISGETRCARGCDDERVVSVGKAAMSVLL